MSNEKNRIPLSEKLNLTVAEAAAYSGLGQHMIRNLLKEDGCPFCVWISEHKVMVRRREFEEYLYSKDDFRK